MFWQKRRENGSKTVCLQRVSAATNQNTLECASSSHSLEVPAIEYSRSISLVRQFQGILYYVRSRFKFNGEIKRKIYENAFIYNIFEFVK